MRKQNLSPSSRQQELPLPLAFLETNSSGFQSTSWLQTAPFTGLDSPVTPYFGRSASCCNYCFSKEKVSKEDICEICCGGKSEHNLWSCSYFRQTIVLSWCKISVYKLVISMVVSIAFLGMWLMFWILLRKSVMSCRKLPPLSNMWFKYVP